MTVLPFDPFLEQLVLFLMDGQYHDRAELSCALHLSQEKVAALITKLIHYGIHIEAVEGKGYILLEPLILLNKNKIEQLAERSADVTVFESVASTMSLPGVNAQHFQVYVAEHQTAGRGRLDRPWLSPFAQNLYFTAFYLFKKDLRDLAGLGLVVSLAVLKTMKAFDQEKHFFVKWPNDILYERQKLSGTLIEITTTPEGFLQAVIGIGMNVNMAVSESTINQPWTSLRKIFNNYIDRNILAAQLIKHLKNNLKRFDEQGFVVFVKEWMQHEALLHEEITLKSAEQFFRGSVLGVNDRGYLLIKLPDGEVRAFSAGEALIMK